MRALASRRLAALASLALTLVAARVARADVSSENAAAAEVLFQEARALLAQDKVAEACPKLAASERLDPGYGTLWNLADCQARLGQTASAWASFREAADMAKKAGQAERVEKAERRTAELEPKLERLSVVVKRPAPGLAVTRGAITLEPALWGTALPVDPGKHTLQATAPGKKPFTLEVATRGPGETVTVEIPPLANEDVAPVAPPPPPPSTGQRRVAGFALGGVGLAGLIVGAATGLVARSRWNDAQTHDCPTPTRCSAAGVSEVSEAKTFATTSTVGFVAGGVLLASGVVLVLTAPSRRAAPSVGAVALSPRVGPGFATLAATMAF